MMTKNYKGLATREDFCSGEVYFEVRSYKNLDSMMKESSLDFRCASRWYNDDFTAREMQCWMVGHKEALRRSYKNPHVALFFVDKRKGIEKILDAF